jgi:recombination protein RecR
MPEEQARSLAEAVLAVKDRIVLCSECYNITESDPCSVCSEPGRDQTSICVVEEALDALALERTRTYKGLYHVLHGVISPMNGIGPDDLKIQPLLGRIKRGNVQEIILATNPNLEGEATAMYIYKIISPLGVKVTHPARGLPVGGDLEYADEVTLGRAIEGRQEF